MRYPVPDLPAGVYHTSETEVEKSRFITWLNHAPDIAAFDALLAAARHEHPTATHHCSAFIAGPPGEQNAIGFSDDGEPGGTAGRPMYQVLEGSGMGQVGCVVIRYFGGTKLGTGGLARAYAQTVANALETLPQRQEVEHEALRLQVDFAGEAEARAWLAAHEAPIQAVDYTSDGVLLTAAWPSDITLELASLQARLRGNIRLVDE